MKKLNKKGFTLIELLAVIVVLAIIMVIATQQVNKTISKARSNSFIESYQMVVKQVKTFIASDEDAKCSGAACLTKYELSDDYDADYTYVNTDGEGKYVIKLAAKSDDGKFKTLNLIKYGNASNAGKCDPAKIGFGATGCDAKYITGEVEF